jgi:hypothetical protein
MKMRLLFVLVALAIGIEARSQNFGLGISGIYNFQTEAVGAGLRGVIFPDRTVSFTPQVSYFFPFNKVNELTFGLSLDYKFIKARKFYGYGLAHAGYNRWYDYLASELPEARPNNWNFELGLGISGRKCLRPFAEYRYNVKFRETHLNVGLLYVFGCGGKSKGGSKKRGNNCPAYQ